MISFGSTGNAATDVNGDGSERKEGDGSSGPREAGGTGAERKEGSEVEAEEKDGATNVTASGAHNQSSTAAGQFRLNYNKMRFTSEKESSGLDVNDSLFWEKLMGNSAVSLVIPPDELLAQLTDQSAAESTESRAVFVSRLERTAQSILDAKKRGEEADVDALVNLLIQFGATSAFSEDERAKAGEWLLEAEKRHERRARLRVREEESADKRRSSLRRGFPEALRRSGRRKRRDTTEAEGAELLAGEDSDFSLGDSDAFSDDERTRGGRVRGRAGALMNVDLCDVCWTSGSLLGCDGPCERWFHLACLQMDEPPDAESVWLCADCEGKAHTCRICGQRDLDDWKGDNGVRCCSVPKCGLFFHLACVRDNPLTVFYSDNSNSSFKCPAHYCYKCAAIGEVYYVHCLTCQRAEHVKCMGSAEVRLAKKVILCEVCVERERQTERGKAAIEGSIVHTQAAPVREKRKLKRPRKSGSSRRKEGGRTGERRMSRQQWDRMTEEEREVELARRAERRQEQKARAREKQREKRALKRAARLGLSPEDVATVEKDEHSDSSASSSASSSSSGSSSHSSSSDSASESDSSSSSSSASSSSSSASASSASSASSSSDDSDAAHKPSTYFRPGSYVVRFMLDGEKQHETARQAMFHPQGKRRRQKSRRLDSHKEERRRKKEKSRRAKEKKDRARRARHMRRKRKEEKEDRARKEERAKRGKEEKAAGEVEAKANLKEELKENGQQASQAEPSEVAMRIEEQTAASKSSAVKSERADVEMADEERKEEKVRVKAESEDEKGERRSGRKKRRSSTAAHRPEAAASKETAKAASAIEAAEREVKATVGSDSEERKEIVDDDRADIAHVSPSKPSEERESRNNRRSSRSVASASKADKQPAKVKQERQDSPGKALPDKSSPLQRRRSTRSPPTVKEEAKQGDDSESESGGASKEGKVLVRVRMRDRRHDALVGQQVMGALRSRRLARITEEDGEEERGEGDSKAAKRGKVKSEQKQDDASARMDDATSKGEDAQAASAMETD